VVWRLLPLCARQGFVLTCCIAQEGTACIYDRYSEGKAFSKDVVAILTARVAAEERYAKELAAIAAKANGLTEVQATLPAAWVSLRDSHAARAEAHSALAKKLQAEVVKVLTDDIRERSVKKGELFEEDKSLHAQLAKHKSATESALQRFLTASAQAEASRKQFHFAQQDASIPPKKLKVLEAQEAKLSGEADKAHESYKQTLSELNAYQKQYEESLGVLLEKLQEMDTSRGALLSNMTRVYLDAHLALAKSDTQTNEVSSKAVGQIDATADQQSWIQANKNGLAPEPLVEYEGYELQFENATADEVPNPSKVGKVFSKSTLRKTQGTAGGASAAPAKEEKKLARQKSLSRLLGNKSKGVSRKGDPPISSPNGAAATSNISPGRKNSTSDTSSPNKLSNSSPVISSPVKTDGPKISANSVGSASAAAAATAPGKQSKGGRKAKALFEFIASDDTEISFAVGDIVTVVRVDESGWWDCDKDGELGLAPGNYLQFIEEEAPKAAAPASPRGKQSPVTSASPVAARAPAPVEASEESSEEPKKNIKTSVAAAKQPDPEPEPEPEEVEDEEAEPIGWATALYDFAGDGDDELPVKTGDRVEVYAEIEGWFSASGKDGKYGLCPKNFFSELKPL
jgi:hypothetical protein